MKISPLAATAPLFSRLRSLYLDSLYEPQAFYSELLNRESACFLLQQGDEAAGYFLKTEDATLLEFYVTDARLAEAAFDEVLHSHDLKRAICKTFDPLFLSLCLGQARQSKALGMVYTVVTDARFQPEPALVSREAISSDFEAVMAINDNFFDSTCEIRAYIEHRHLQLYLENNELVGCGLLQPVIAGGSAYDIGMLVKSCRRRQGLGEYIVRHLKAQCLSAGLRPVCACGVENGASRACLEAAGFASRHRIVEFDF
jgi:ribosomal protein S18 acetylase RimI-like enzyme